MKNSKLIFASFFNSLGVTAYISAIALIMRNAEKIFGQKDNFFSPVAFLLLFVLSAAITASLVLGRPVLLYLGNRKPEAIKLFLYTIGWLFILTIIAFAATAFVARILK